MNFEFEFTIVRDNKDIIINPMKDIVPGKGIIEVEITYKPSVNVTAIMEVEVWYTIYICVVENSPI